MWFSLFFALVMDGDELYELTKLKKSHFKFYKVDTLSTKHGHSVLRLPSYHSELNSTKKIGARIKNWVVTRDVTLQTDDTLRSCG